MSRLQVGEKIERTSWQSASACATQRDENVRTTVLIHQKDIPAFPPPTSVGRTTGRGLLCHNNIPLPARSLLVFSSGTLLRYISGVVV